MSDEKPLHVRVAEALGAECSEVGGVWYDDAEIDAADARHDSFSARPLPHYDTDWSATGPLIDRFDLVIVRSPWDDGFLALRVTDALRTIHVPFHPHGYETRLIAVCEAIVALAAAGKLPKASE